MALLNLPKSPKCFRNSLSLSRPKLSSSSLRKKRTLIASLCSTPRGNHNRPEGRGHQTRRSSESQLSGAANNTNEAKFSEAQVEEPEVSAITSCLSRIQIRPINIPMIFATVSSFEASYLQLQTAHVPFVEENVTAADFGSDMAALCQFQFLTITPKFLSIQIPTQLQFKPTCSTQSFVPHWTCSHLKFNHTMPDPHLQCRSSQQLQSRSPQPTSSTLDTLSHWPPPRPQQTHSPITTIARCSSCFNSLTHSPLPAAMFLYALVPTSPIHAA